MIIRFTSEQLRKLADQVDAYTALSAAGAEHPRPNTVLSVDGRKLAYLAWWQDREEHMAEVICFVPGDAEPLEYHADVPAGTGTCRRHQEPMGPARTQPAAIPADYHELLAKLGERSIEPWNLVWLVPAGELDGVATYVDIPVVHLGDQIDQVYLAHRVLT